MSKLVQITSNPMDFSYGTSPGAPSWVKVLERVDIFLTTRKELFVLVPILFILMVVLILRLRKKK